MSATPNQNVPDRRIRNLGFVACLIGALVMITARFTAILPHAAIWVGLVIVALGWALFALSIVRRARGSKG